MAFDPMTGKPIIDDEKTVMFDPLTGEPISNEPVNVETAQPAPKPEQPTGFDPMTGEPIYGQPKQAEPQPTGFDPMTGEPIYGQPKQAEPQPTGFDPMTGKPIYGQKQKRKKGKLPIILGVIVAAVVLAAVLITGIIKIAAPASVKVLTATKNTFKDKPYIVRDLEPVVKIAKSKKFTLGVTGELYNNTITSEAVCSEKRYQLSVDIDGDDVDNFSAIADLDSEALSLYVPKLSKKVIQYNYNKSARGYLEEAFKEDDIRTFNNLLKGIVNSGNGEGLKDDFSDALKTLLKELEYEKIEADTFEVNDKDVKCNGYRVKLTRSAVKKFLKEIDSKMSKRKYADSLASMCGYKSFDNMMDELDDEVDNMDSSKVSFYIYKNKLAAVIIEGSDMDIEIDFKGGNYRTQNLEITGKDNYGKYTLLKIKGSYDNKVEKLKLSSESYELGTIEYNTKTGKVEIDFGRVFTVEGKLDSSSSKLAAEIDTLKMGGVSIDVDDFTLSLSNKAKFAKIDSDKTFDVGDADEDDFKDLFDDMEDGIEDLGIENFLKKF